jgi:hypothetical protein
MNRILASAVASIAIAASAGCSAAADQAATTSHPSPVAATSIAQPIPVPQLKHLPPGAIYILGGMTASDSNLWQVASTGIEEKLTSNPRGFGIDSFAASQAGIVLADAQYGADQLARWTWHGPQWLRLPGHAKTYINGQEPGIRPDGQILYLLPPAEPGHHGDRDYTLWVKKSFAGPARMIYRQRTFPGVPIFGPRGQVAVVGPIGPSTAKSPKPGIVIISRTGKIRKLSPGFTELGYPPVWGQNAPALAIPPWKGPARLIFPDGRHQTLPTGWRPEAWNPSGTALLMLSKTSLGIWSLRNPGKVKAIARLTPGFEIDQVSWLARKAPA